MNKKFSIITFIVIIALSLAGCSMQEKPEDTVAEFFNAMKNFDLEVMASKVNPEDRDEEDQVFDFDEEDDLFQEYLMEYIKSNAKKITYKINEAEIDGDSAIVNVDVKHIDGGPLFRATFREYMKEVFALAFMQDDISDEENAEIFISSMKEQEEIIEESFVEKTFEIDCIKIEDEWYIDNPSDELLDVAMSNFLSVAESIDDSFNFDSDSTLDESDAIDESEEETNFIEKTIGDEIELATIKFKVNSVEEVAELESIFGSAKTAKEGAKFVLVDIDITNTTNSEFSLPQAFLLIDDKDREFNTYSDSIGAVDNYMEYRDLSPSIKENGYLIYEIPEDSSSYSIFARKAESNDVYEVILK